MMQPLHLSHVMADNRSATQSCQLGFIYKLSVKKQPLYDDTFVKNHEMVNLFLY